MQLARVLGLFPSHSGEGHGLQDRRHVAAHLRIRGSGVRPRRSQHVLHAARYLDGHPRLDRRTVHLQGYVSRFQSSIFFSLARD